MLFVNSLEKFGHALRCNRKCRRHKKCVVNYIYFFFVFFKKCETYTRHKLSSVETLSLLAYIFTVLAPTRENVS